MSEYIAKAPIEPRDYRVVFLIQEKPESQPGPGFWLYFTTQPSLLQVQRVLRILLCH